MSDRGHHTELLPGTATLTWWHAGGLHAHVSYPDGSWMRRTWRAHEYFEIDALAWDLKDKYESVDVKP